MGKITDNYHTIVKSFQKDIEDKKIFYNRLQFLIQEKYFVLS